MKNNKANKSKLKSIATISIASLLILVGISLAIIPILGRILNQQSANTQIESYQQSVSDMTKMILRPQKRRLMNTILQGIQAIFIML